MALLDAVVVGAGMAGLACSRRLQQAGYTIAVLEKSRGLGGRLATRRVDGTPIDHGARFLQPQGEMLTRLVHRMAQQGLLSAWQPRRWYLNREGKLHGIAPSASAAPYYGAPAGMSAVGKAIASDLPILRQQRVIRLTPGEQGWCIQAQQTDTVTAVEHTAKAVILALPAPQIVPLLAPLRSRFPLENLWSALATITYAPCLTVIAQYPRPNSQTQGELEAPTAPWAVEGHPETAFFWLGLDSSKRQTPDFNVVIHSSAIFARTWLESANLQLAGEALLAEAGQLIAPWLQHPSRWQVHRWRYARVETPCIGGPLSSEVPWPLVCCGDWCGDRQLDTAWESGWAAADIANQQLRHLPLPDFSPGLVEPI